MLISGSFFNSKAFAANKKKEGNCQKIKAECLKAGFSNVKTGEPGKGVWPNCVKSLFAGKVVEGTAIPLPEIDPEVVRKCKADVPDFAEGKK